MVGLAPNLTLTMQSPVEASLPSFESGSYTVRVSLYSDDSDALVLSITILNPSL